MKRVVAVVRSGKKRETRDALAEAGVSDYTAFRVYGRGRQRGLRYGSRPAAGLSFLPKWLFEVIVGDDRAEAVVDALLKANQTGHYGDGRIFLFDVQALPDAVPEEAVR